MSVRAKRTIGAATAAVVLLLAAGCDLAFKTDLFKDVIETVEADDPTAPAAPTDLAAVAASDSQIDLSWTDASDNESEFQIQRKKTSGGDWQTVVTVGADSTGHSDQGLDEETGYAYRVRAANSAGSSAWSGEASATTPRAPRFRVFYNGNGYNGGTVPTDSSEYKAGASVTVSGPGTMTRSGYTFAGWNTVANGSGTAYMGGVTLVMPAANVTLYAQWTTNPTYKVTYYGNGNTGGTVPVDSNAYQTGATVTVRANTGNLVRTGYVFDGWNTASNGSGTHYAPAETFAMGSANVNLYAEWEPTYSVTYLGNGQTSGSPPVDTSAYKAGDTVTVLGNTGKLLKIDKVNPAYRFSGWSDGSGNTYNGGDHFSMPSHTVTLTAIWTPYVVGDVGPGGGIVFYDKGVYSGSGILWRYLEAAPSDQSAGIQWGGEETSTGASGTTLGYGETNTMSIVNKLGAGSYAARICWDLSLGGYTDWFLPCRDELVQMYNKRAVIGGFATTSFYWSSSEANSIDAYNMLFQFGEVRTETKGTNGRVRALRYF